MTSERTLLCIGATNIDRKLRTLAPLQAGVSNPAQLTEVAGGVARNVAENLARLGWPVVLLSAVAEDATGRDLLAQAQSLGIATDACLRVADGRSGSYTAILDADGELVMGLADMALVERLTPQVLQAQQDRAGRKEAALIVADLNLPTASLESLLADAQDAQASQQPLVFVAVSAPKMTRLPARLAGLHCLVMNDEELAAIDPDADSALRLLGKRGVRHVVVTQGASGVRFGAPGEPLNTLPAPPVEVVDVTGAGDAFAAGLCHGLARGHTLQEACASGLQLAALTLQCSASVFPALNPNTL